MTFTDSEKNIIFDWLSERNLLHSNYEVIVNVFYSFSTTQTDYFEGVVASDVRFKLYGFDTDMQYRIPTIQATLQDFPRLSQLQSSPNSFRFYLSVVLRYVDSESSNVDIRLLRSCWFKLKEYEILPTTSDNTVMKDVSITGIPRVYEYNTSILWGPKDYEDSQTSYDKLSGMSRLAKSAVDASRIIRININESGSSTIVESVTSPCPSSGPRFNLVTGQNYTELDLGTYPVRVGKSEEATFFSWASRLFVYLGWAIVPEQYQISPPEEDDVPELSWISIWDIVSDKSVSAGRFISGGLNSFTSIEPSDTSCRKRIATRYEVSQDSYAGDSGNTTDAQVVFESPIFGWVEFDGWSFRNSGSADEIVITNILEVKSHEGSVSSGVRNYAFQINKNDGRTFISPSNPRPTYGVIVSGYLVSSVVSSTSYYSEFDNPEKSVTVKVLSDSYNGSDHKLVRAYSVFEYEVTFSAEWRPWINIYDVIRVSYMDELGQNRVSSALVISIDANVDTFSATYTALIFPPDYEPDLPDDPD